ncbi:MAG: hypothetical protein HYY93_05885, partial [Planctomycetes bacterium]|nr:hypothetical protein [Planctomycetota bacterium]
MTFTLTFSEPVHGLALSTGVGVWSTATTTFATPREGHTSVVYNGYLYVIGGNGGSGVLNDVQYASINPDGSVGAWATATTTFATPRIFHTSVVYNGFLYVIGGSDGVGVILNDVQYAAINSDGSVGAWATATTTFATPR